MRQYYSKQTEATHDRVTHLYRTKYRREVKREGYKGMDVWTEGMKRAYAQMKQEYDATKIQTAKSNTKPSRLLQILPKPE